MPTTEVSTQRETKLEALLKELLTDYFTDDKVLENPALANTRERLLALLNLSQTTHVTTTLVQETKNVLSGINLGDNTKFELGNVEANEIGVQINFNIYDATPNKTLSTTHVTELELIIWNVTQGNQHFTGRNEQLKDLKEKLLTHSNCTVTQTIAGLGGVGKSSLVKKYAYQHAGDYQIVWWCDAATLDTDYYNLAQELNVHGDTLGLKGEIDVESRNADAIREGVKQCLSQLSHWLLIIDNAADEKSIQAYLPSRHQPTQPKNPGHILITSRNEHWQQAKIFNLSVFSLDESVTLLDSILKGPRDKESGPDQPSKPLRLNAEEIALAKDLAELLGNLPLALMQAGFYMKETGTSLEKYIERFKTERGPLWQEEDAPHDYHATVAVTWKISMAQVEKSCPAAITLLNHCAYLASTFIDKRWLVPLVSNQLGQAIRTLRAFSLIDWQETGFKCHGLVQAVIRDAHSPALRINFIQQIVFSLGLTFISEPAYAHDFETNRQLESHLLRLWQHYQDKATRLATREPIQIHALALTMAVLLNQLGAIYIKTMGTPARAKSYLTKAVEIFETQLGPSHTVLATSYNNLGLAYCDLGGHENVKQAIGYHEKALAIFETQLGSSHSQVAAMYNNLAAAYRNLGGRENSEQAMTYFKKALAIWEPQLGPNHPKVAIVHHNLGMAYLTLGGRENSEQAITYVKKALAIFETQLGLEHPNLIRCRANFKYAQTELIRLKQTQENELHASSPNKFFKIPSSEKLDTATSQANLGKKLRNAAAKKDIENLKMYIKKVKNINAQDNKMHKKTALHWAVIQGFKEGVVLLLKSGAKIDIKDASGNTPYYYAQVQAHQSKLNKAILDLFDKYVLEETNDEYILESTLEEMEIKYLAEI